jgi:sRNA-binding carbon storage regulator CsrA|tara:strand:+ start:568 stop:921 length:354 start_codon:yes stop_codon:yes gene_type:complete
MTVTQLTKLVEAVGIPAAVAAGMGFLLWKLLQYILRDLRSDMSTQHSELEQTLRTSRTILIQLVDRVRVLERNIYRHQDATAVRLGINAPQYDITRKEKYDEAMEIVGDVSGKINGD